MKIAIAGRGRSGKAAHHFLLHQGHHTEFLDDADGSLIAERILNFEAIVLSPGIPRAHPAIKAAILAKIPIYNEIDMAVSYLPECQFVGITGTNGKSTTTALLGHIVTAFEPNTFVGGNLGRPLCEALAAGEYPRYAILELSSFQLETLSKLKLDVAALLNLTPDHLDRYPSIEAYYDTKRKIFDLLKPGGVKISLGTSLLNMKPSSKLLGQHNIQNMKAAVLAAQALHIPDDIIQRGLDTFPGIVHRLEILGQKNGVTWINDSKATNVESAKAALACFDSGVYLILGGLGKGASYEPLVSAALKCVKKIYVLGEDAPNILKFFPEAIETHTLEQAVKLAYQQAKSGDTVLLAPACASYDQFKNFEHRGDVFRSLFHGL
ncbi:MAG: UDP-N-acetylmuramoyl-L-alanine--D-glutamate ligase [Myxococcaceae bacterium]